MQTFKRHLDKWLIVMFMLLVTVPSLGLLIKHDPEEFKRTLKRAPFELPKISIKRLGRTDFKGIEDWYADRLLFVPTLSKIWNDMNYQMGRSSKPGQAIVGRDGWLFLGNDYNHTLDQYTGRDTASPPEIAHLTQAFKQLDRASKQYSIPFLVAIVPEKHRIYPEYLPKFIQRSSQQGRFEQLKTTLSAEHIEFVDLEKAEMAAKTKLGDQYGDLYLKGDSHWNYLGAYAAYQTIAAYLNQKGLQTSQHTFKFITGSLQATDLAGFLQLDKIVSNYPTPDISQLSVDLWSKDGDHFKKMAPFQGSSNYDLLQRPSEVINKAVKNNQTCLLISDSFSEALSFYLHNDFYKTVRVHYGNSKTNIVNLITTYHPDVIIFQMVERNLRLGLNQKPWLTKDV